MLEIFTNYNEANGWMFWKRSWDHKELMSLLDKNDCYQGILEFPLKLLSKSVSFVFLQRDFINPVWSVHISLG